ncbi:MAG: HAD family hydrolase [Chloroflexi bacterium]|nr:HAD family hydrolase [Chloroflexota bacterium]
MTPLRAVTFDLWQTLLLDRREAWAARARYRAAQTCRLLEETGLHYPLERIEAAGRECFRIAEDLRTREQDLSFQEQIALYLEMVEPGLSGRLPGEARERIAGFYGGSIWVQSPNLAPGVPEVLVSLRGQGLHLGLISNTGVTPGSVLRELLRRRGILDYFDALTFSDEVGLSKPAIGIFLMTLERLGVAPGETAHVGDHPRADIFGAQRAGLRAIQVDCLDPREQVAEPDARIPSLRELPAALVSLDGSGGPGWVSASH